MEYNKNKFVKRISNCQMVQNKIKLLANEREKKKYIKSNIEGKTY